MAVDAVTLQVLRHRLQAINDEQIGVTVRTSGSPTVYEAYDVNSSIITPSGEALAVGHYVMALSLSFDVTVKYVLERFAENPGIFDGDIFYTNDPWAGATHQNDTVMVAPIFWEDDIVAWTGVSLHEMDVGGPLAGGYGAQAKDIYGEAPLIPPVKVVERGVVRNDIEEAIVRNSRTPAFNGLDMRGRLAAITRTRTRMREIIQQYGKDTFMEVQEQILDLAQEAFARRLRELPDGTWRQEGFLDYRRLYRVRLVATKEGDRLTLDFRDSSNQAPAMVNATRSLLEGCAIASILTELCYDLPWAPAAFFRNVDVLSKPATIVHALHPAGVGQGATAVGALAQSLVSTAVSKMFAATERYRDEAQANWVPSTKRPVVSGLNRRGETYAITLIDEAGGGGALSFRDGPDSVHLPGGPMMALGNIEVYERLYPVLYLYRKHTSDTGGPGKFRGGLGTEQALTPHRGRSRMQLLNLAGCSAYPEARGLYGGLPAPAQPSFLLRGADVYEQMASGNYPYAYEQLASRSDRVIKSREVVRLSSGDVYVAVQTGGAGYGDPLERDPQRVLSDYLTDACSLEACRAVYGVVIDPQSKTIDADETASLRDALRCERRPGDAPAIASPDGTDITPILSLGDAVSLFPDNGAPAWHCQRCHHRLGPATEDFRRQGHLREVPIDSYSRWNVFGWVDLFILREVSCPNCGMLLDVQPRRKSDPTMYDSLDWRQAAAAWQSP